MALASIVRCENRTHIYLLLVNLAVAGDNLQGDGQVARCIGDFSKGVEHGTQNFVFATTLAFVNALLQLKVQG